MNQINVHPSHETDVVETGNDRAAAASINLITVLIVLAVLAVVLWYLFTGPLRVGSSGGSTTINVQNPAPTVVVNPPSQPNAPAPAGNTGGSGSNGGTNPPSNNPPSNNPPSNNPPPANP